jgi:hypothetical protein
VDNSDVAELHLAGVILFTGAILLTGVILLTGAILNLGGRRLGDLPGRRRRA